MQSREEITGRLKKLREKDPFINNTDAAYEKILCQILKGYLKPLDKIPQETIAEYLKMSRTPGPGRAVPAGKGGISVPVQDLRLSGERSDLQQI